MEMTTGTAAIERSTGWLKILAAQSFEQNRLTPQTLALCGKTAQGQMPVHNDLLGKHSKPCLYLAVTAVSSFKVR